jgi:hypothetical protein
MGISLDRVACSNCTSVGRARGSTAFSRIAETCAARKSSFWTNPVGPCRHGGAREAAAGALALQLLANSDRLPKGGCALKRLSEDFRICHCHGRLDQSVARCAFLSTSYRPAAPQRALAKAKSRHPRSTGDPGPCGPITVAAHVAIIASRVALVRRPAPLGRLLASSRRRPGRALPK